MKLLAAILLLCNSIFAQDIDKYQWKNRVVIIFGHIENELEVKQQLEAFKPFRHEIVDREMIILAPRKGERFELLQQLNLNDDYSGLILIGKDGGIKLQQKLVTNPETLFKLIDTMPMRRAEVQKKTKKPN